MIKFCAKHVFFYNFLTSKLESETEDRIEEWFNFFYEISFSDNEWYRILFGVKGKPA